MADGARNCVLEDCEVAHVGTYGVWFRRGCKDCRIQRNRLFDLGAGGVRVGEANMAPTDEAESSRIVVDNNHIFDGGHVYAAGIGVWVAQSSHNQDLAQRHPRPAVLRHQHRLELGLGAQPDAPQRDRIQSRPRPGAWRAERRRA